MSLLAVMPGLAPGLLARLPQFLLLFALFVVLLSPRTWWRVLGYTVRRPKWALLLVLTAGGRLVLGTMSGNLLGFTFDGND